MRVRLFGPCLVLMVVAAACAGPASPPDFRSKRSGQLLVLAAGSAVTSVDPVTGALLFSGPATAAPTDPGRLFVTTWKDESTTLALVTAATGTTAATVRLDGTLAIRVVSADGDLVALMPPHAEGSTPWTPTPRGSTDIVVADPRGYLPTARFHLKGNLEPEAFSADGTVLYLIRYVPAMEPRAYRVAALDLATGDVWPVTGRSKSARPETMSGRRLDQVMSPDGLRLYTLYSTQPPEYAQGFDPAQASAGRPVAFVHTLSLDEGWAICVGLPKAFWGGDPGSEALAVSATTGQLYVVDSARSVIAVVDPDELNLTRKARVDFGPGAAGTTRAAIDPQGETLFVATGTRVVQLDAETLGVRRAWDTGAPASGLAFDATGSRLYIALPNEVEAVSSSTGNRLARIPAPGLGRVDTIAALTPAS